LVNNHQIRLVLLGIVFLSFTCFSRSDAASFQGLGYVPGKDWVSQAYAVSADGLVVVGISRDHSFTVAFRWTAEDSMQNLGYLSGENTTEATGVSADGSIVVGWSQKTGSGDVEAFRWTQSGGMVGLGDLAGGPFLSYGYDVSSDGSAVVGTSWSASGFEAFRWTQSGGMVGLGDLPGGEFESQAYGISSDGLVVVGRGWSAGSPLEAFRWTETGGMVGIGGTKARDVSDDGSVIVGSDGRWTESGGWQDIGLSAYGVSADGSVVIGYNGVAFIWDERYGTQNLKDWLENVFSLDLTDWTLTMAKGISADGLKIVGYGTNPSGNIEAWRAVIDPVVNVPDVTEMAQADAESTIISAELTIGDITYEYSNTVPKGYVTSQSPVAGAWAPINSEVNIVISLGQLVCSIIHVDGDAPDGGNGMSWETAFIYLQDALRAAESTNGDVNEIRVAESIYKPDRDFTDPNGSGNRSATFGLINGVVIKGGYAGFGETDANARDIQLYETILSGDLDGNDVGELDDSSRNENSYHIVTGSGNDANAILNGFTITGGNANSTDSDSDGAGMYNYQGSPTIIECTFRANLAVRNGAGMHNSYGSPVVINCVFMNNSAGNRGGGIYCYWSDAMLTNCIFSGNLSPYGGGMRTYSSDSVLTNCTFSSNSATLGGGVYNNGGNPTLTNCILWGDTPEEIYVSSGTPVVTYSDVQGGWSGSGNNNIAVDPCFADSNNGDYHLKSQVGRWDPNTETWVDDDVTSLCIDEGDPNADWTNEPWPNGFRVNMGAYGNTSEATRSPVDFDDLAVLAYYWLTDEPLVDIAPEPDGDGIANFLDFALLADFWRSGQ
jgi:probable HAF family extracellular repeat protein